MKEATPTIKDWQALYEVALEYKKLKCWDWMYDSHTFGVQNPANDEIGYCCIMGNAGEFYALAVYLGTEGLEGYLNIQRGMFDSQMDALASQKCLMVSFEDREELTDKDRQIIKELGLKFRGKKEWVLFRNYEPGYLPWYLNKAEVEFLTLAIEQAMDVAVRFSENPDKLFSYDETYLVRVPKKTKSGLEWSDKWMKPEPLKEDTQKDMIPSIQEESLKEVLENIGRLRNIWEIDVSMTTFKVSEKQGDRPFYPYMSLFIDQKSGLSLGVGMSDFWNYKTEFINKFLDNIVKIGIPSEVHVRKREVYELLSIIAKQLDIRLVFSKRLRALEEFEDFSIGRMI